MTKAIVRMVVLSAAYVALAFAYLALAINVAVDLVIREFALLVVPRAVRSEIRRLNPVVPAELRRVRDPAAALRTCNTTGPGGPWGWGRVSWVGGRAR